eukprot:m.172611 g.172611  ORF g.172611 m.172611 type:complete len:517 (+) comp17860_c0_seq1:1883-3433(+)
MGDLSEMDLPALNAFIAEGTSLEQAGQYRKALEKYTAALEAVSPNGILDVELGRLCLTHRSRMNLRLGNYDAALADAEQSLSIDDTFPKGIHAKAEALYSKGEFEYALVFYHRGNKLRSEMAEFRLGIQKSEEAIMNAIGSPDCALSNDGDLTLFNQTKDGGYNKASKPPAGRGRQRSAKKKKATGAGSDKTVKQLLGELYADRQFLEELMADPSMQTATSQVTSLASGGVAYLDRRTEFWRQQKPMYARVNEKQQRTMRATKGATRKGSQKKATTQFILSSLEKIDDALEQGDADKALAQAKGFLKALENEKVPDKDRILGDVYSAMGNAHFELEQFDESLRCHEKDLRLADLNSLEDSKGRALGNIGRVHANQGEYQLAVDTWLEKVPITTSTLESAWLYHEIGRCYLGLDNAVSALEYGQKSLACADEANDGRWKLNAKILVAQSQATLGDTMEASETYQEALHLAENLDDTPAVEAIQKALDESLSTLMVSAPTEADLDAEGDADLGGEEDA